MTDEPIPARSSNHLEFKATLLLITLLVLVGGAALYLSYARGAFVELPSCIPLTLNWIQRTASIRAWDNPHEPQTIVACDDADPRGEPLIGRDSMNSRDEQNGNDGSQFSHGASILAKTALRDTDRRFVLTWAHTGPPSIRPSFSRAAAKPLEPLRATPIQPV